MDPLASTLAHYHPTGAVETEDVARLRSMIGRGDPWSRDQPLHVTASALVVEPVSRRVLLRWHPRMRQWLQVGGHGDPGERDPWQVACREAREETGLTDLRPLTPALTRQPVQVVIVPVPAYGQDPAHEHADIRYLLATTRPGDAVAESPEARLRWMAITDATADAQEENLRECLRRIGPWLPA